MDHADAHELIELAAAEPGGLERLMAGDTRDATVLAAHLAGCPECPAEVDRIRQDSEVLREVVRAAPRAELRQRTLAYVRVVGRDRGLDAAERAVASVGGPASGDPTKPGADGNRPNADIDPGPAAVTSAPAAAAVGGRSGRRSRWRLAGVGQLAAAVALVAVIAGSSALIALRVQAEIQSQQEVAAAIARVTTWTLRVDGADDGRRVELSDRGVGGANGTLVFAPSRGELVVVARGLVEPPGDTLYRCWVEVDGERRNVGRMFFGGGIAYWAGRVDGLAEVPVGAVFGIGKVGPDGSLEGSTPELEGSL
jgi:hypothetical protein